MTTTVQPTQIPAGQAAQVQVAGYTSIRVYCSAGLVYVHITTTNGSWGETVRVNKSHDFSMANATDMLITAQCNNPATVLITGS